MTFKLTDAYKKAPYLFSHEFILKYNISPPPIYQKSITTSMWQLMNMLGYNKIPCKIITIK